MSSKAVRECLKNARYIIKLFFKTNVFPTPLFFLSDVGEGMRCPKNLTRSKL